MAVDRHPQFPAGSMDGGGGGGDGCGVGPQGSAAAACPSTGAGTQGEGAQHGPTCAPCASGQGWGYEGCGSDWEREGSGQVGEGTPRGGGYSYTIC